MDAPTLIEKFLAGWSNDLPLLLSIFADDVEYVDAPLEAEMHGKAALETFAKPFFVALPDIRFTLVGTPFHTANRGAFEWRLTGTHLGDLMGFAPTGRPVDFAGATLISIEGGLISRAIDYWDQVALLRQIGQLPA